MKRNVLIGALVTLVTLSGTTSAYALVNVRETTTNISETAQSTVEEVTSTVKDVETGVATNVEKIVPLKERIAQRKVELEQRLAAKAEMRKERLEGRRLARCQNRQELINNLIDKSAATGLRHLQNIQRVEERVKQFAEKKSISSEAYTASLESVDEKEAAAAAAVGVLETQSFDCATVDGAAPGSGIRTIREAKQTALSEYRTSVVGLIQTVKSEFASQQSDPEAQSTEEQ